MQHVQTRSTTSALVLTAVLIALATLFTMYTKIPVPGIRGYFNVGDVVIMTSALLLGRKYGAYIGALGPGASRFISRLCSLCTHHLRGERT